MIIQNLQHFSDVFEMGGVDFHLYLYKLRSPNSQWNHRNSKTLYLLFITSYQDSSERCIFQGKIQKYQVDFYKWYEEEPTHLYPHLQLSNCYWIWRCNNLPVYWINNKPSLDYSAKIKIEKIIILQESNSTNRTRWTTWC